MSVLVGLVGADDILVLLIGVSLAVYILQQREVLGAAVEVVLREHAVVYEELQVVPLLLILLAVLLEYAVQAVGHLLGDVRRNLLHVGIALQI